MNTTFSLGGAARAYQSARQLPVAEVPRMAEVANSERPSFQELLTQTATESVQTIRAGEAAAVAGVQGQMPMQKVVEATMAMESALKVTVALRDRVVEAYQEVMRMSV